MDFTDIKGKIRRNVFFRTMIYPIASMKKRKTIEEYRKSDNPAAIRQYKNKHLGERCFIIGNGPSLVPEDLDLLQNETSFACNRIYNVFSKTGWRPTYFCCIDRDVINKNLIDIANEITCVKFLDISAENRVDIGDVIYIISNPTFLIRDFYNRRVIMKEDVSQFFSNGCTVTYTMLQLAVYMGFKEIILIGQDFSMPYYRDKYGFVHKTDEIKAHFSGGDSFKKSFLSRDGNLLAYNKAKEYCDKNGIKIYNATRGGKLEVFERKKLEDILKN